MLASGSIALNSAAMYAGQALGAGGGGWLIAQGSMYSLHWFGLAGMLAAMAMSWWATRQPAHRARAES
jgi:predicted MFS family arabinose efflux permease